MKERFGDSSKLLNLKVSIYMNQRNFEEAHNLAVKLYQVMTTKEKFFDKLELEACFSNLIVLGTILGKPSDEYAQNLKTVNEKTLFLKKIASAKDFFT